MKDKLIDVVVRRSRSKNGWVREGEDARAIWMLEAIDNEFGCSLFESKAAFLKTFPDEKPKKVRMKITLELEPV